MLRLRATGWCFGKGPPLLMTQRPADPPDLIIPADRTGSMRGGVLSDCGNSVVLRRLQFGAGGPMVYLLPIRGA